MILFIVMLVAVVIARAHWNAWYYSSTQHAAVIIMWIATILHLIAAVDMGRPSRITFAGAASYDYSNDDDDKSAQSSLPVYRDVVATGAGEVGMQSRKTGSDSPKVI